MRAAHPQNCLNRQKWLSQNHKTTKKGSCKYQKTNDLKNTLKKEWKRPCLIENTHYFCTRNDAQVLINTGKQHGSREKIYFQKRFKKVCEK
jgi:hypothetical protein